MSVVDRAVTVAPVTISPARARRLLGYGAVGTTGILVDLLVLQALIGVGVHHLFAVLFSYQTAMSFNFLLQRRFVYRATRGNILRQYLRYVIVDVSALTVRFAIVVATVDLASPWLALPYVPGVIAPAVPASLLGIAVAFIIGFGGAEIVVFGEEVRRE